MSFEDGTAADPKELMLRTRSEDRGAVALMVALLTTVLAGLAALVIDLGMARDESRTAQNAADAAALAAAQRLANAIDPEAVTAADITAARAVADGYVRANGWPSGIGTFQLDSAARTVTVALTPVQSPRIFAGALGMGTPTVGASAQATWNGATAGCAVCVLGSLVSRNGQILANSGSVLVGGNLDVLPNGTVTSVGGGIVGVVGSVAGAGRVTPQASPIAGVTDPYGTQPLLPPPARPLGAPAVPATGPACSPGTYSVITACRTFGSGVYVITGGNRFSGNVTIDASSRVFFYVTCSSGGGAPVSSACASGQAGGSLDFAGTVGGTINALTDPAYRGLAIAYDRRNTSPLSLVGGPNLVVNGGVYTASGALTNSGAGPVTVNGTLVVGSITFSGVPSTITVNGNAATAPRAPMLVHLTR
jgi:Flp pilus assembly protein TadG